MPQLSPEQLTRTDREARSILAEVGVRVDHPEIFELLCSRGARGDRKNSVVRMDEDMISKALASCPRTVVLADLEGRTTSIATGSPPLFWGGNALYYERGGKRVDMTEERFVEMVRLYDTLEAVHAIVGTSISDFPPKTRDFTGLRRMAEHGRKHLRPCIYTPDGARIIIEMCQAILGMQRFKGASLKQLPIVSFGFTVVSPLHWTRLALDVFQTTSGFGIPVMVNSEVIAGATSPVTLAGSLCLAVAEVLSGIVIVQALEPGRPTVFNAGFPHIFDMRTAETLTGCVENGLLQAAGGEMARFYGLPSAAWMSTEATVADGQASFEKLLTGLHHAQSGVNLIWGVGNLESTLTISPVQAVIDNEIAKSITRSVAGIRFDEETIAASLVREMGHQSDYLASDHTIRHYRTEVLDSELWNRDRRSRWSEKGSVDVAAKAARIVEERLSRKTESPLDDETRRRLRAIEERGMQELGG
ncbi:MAG: trimethylamine methyltransferase family protein [Spirochaetes bacterium]|nr:trimethylamine methyltransferase family protein [Spirochaetota bacterium]